MQGDFKSKPGTGTPNNKIDAAAEFLEVDVDGYTNIVAVATVENIAGTLAAQMDYTVNGTHWIPFGAAIVHGDLTAVSLGVARTLSDANGMPILAKKVRLRAPTLTGGGIYGFHAAGAKLPGY